MTDYILVNVMLDNVTCWYFLVPVVHPQAPLLCELEGMVVGRNDQNFSEELRALARRLDRYDVYWERFRRGTDAGILQLDDDQRIAKVLTIVYVN